MPKLMLNLAIKDDASASMKGFAETAKKSMADASGYTKRELSALAREAKQLTSSMLTPMERYNAELKRLEGHLGTGRISQETFARATSQAKTQLKEAVEAQKKLNHEVDMLDKGLEKASASWMKMSMTVAAVSGGIYAAKGFLETGIKSEQTEKAFTRIAGSAALARSEIKYLRDEADRLGVTEGSMIDPYKKFTAASRGTSLAGAPSREIFKSVSEAGVTLGLTNEEVSGALQAIEQMVSKGKVQAEELRGQFSERIPGAFRLAAKAMGVTTAELDKMLQQGKVVAEDLLPKLAKQLKSEYGISGSAEGAAAALARMSNAWDAIKRTAYEGEIGKSITSALQRDVETLKVFDQTLKNIKGGNYGDAIKGIWQSLGAAAWWKDEDFKAFQQKQGSQVGAGDLMSLESGLDKQSMTEYFNQIEALAGKMKTVSEAKREMLAFASNEPLLETDQDYQTKLTSLVGNRKDLEEQINQILEWRSELNQKSASESETPGAWQENYAKQAELQNTLEIWQNKLEEVRSEIDEVSNQWASRFDEDMKRAQEQLETLKSQFWDKFSEQIEFNIDTTDALQNLLAVEDALRNIQDMTSETREYLQGFKSEWTVDVLMAKSPAKPWSQGYEELLADMDGLPKGMDYTIKITRDMIDSMLQERNADRMGGRPWEVAQDTQVISELYKRLDLMLAASGKSPTGLAGVNSQATSLNFGNVSVQVAGVSAGGDVSAMAKAFLVEVDSMIKSGNDGGFMSTVRRNI